MTQERFMVALIDRDRSASPNFREKPHTLLRKWNELFVWTSRASINAMSSERFTFLFKSILILLLNRKLNADILEKKLIRQRSPKFVDRIVFAQIVCIRVQIISPGGIEPIDFSYICVLKIAKSINGFN